MAAAGRLIPKIALGAVLGFVVLTATGLGALTVWLDRLEGAPPPLAAGARTGHEGWSARLNWIFPSGTSETALIARLRAEGFEVRPEARNARYEWGSGLPCVYTLTASWSADRGRITSVSGEHLNACL